MDARTEIAAELIELEALLRQTSLWEAEPPSAEAMASSQPFCVDTLSLTQWLQFVFIPRLRQLLEEGGPMPASCAVLPMAEEYFRGQPLAVGSLLASLQKLDELVSAAP